MPNDNTPLSLTPADVVFARKIRYVFSKLLPKQTRPGRTNTVPKKRYQPREKFFFLIFRENKSFWEMGPIEKRIGNIIRIFKGPQINPKIHLNQIRKRLLGDAEK